MSNHALLCSYGSQIQVAFDYHLFTVLLTIPMMYLLLYNRNLRNFYAPLAKLVNLSLILNIVCSGLFFMYMPYYSGLGNCAEIILSRVNTIVVMFGEMHQIYVVAYSLGVGSLTITLSSKWSVNLDTMLKYMLISSITLLVLVALTLGRDILLGVEDVFTVIVSLSQLYVIRMARKCHLDHRTDAVVSINDSSVVIFEKLTYIQVILSFICVCYRGFSLCFTRFVNMDTVFGLVDVICVFLFFVKVLIVQENASSVEVEMV